MLVPFVIDADSLEDTPEWSPATLRAHHDSLLDAWSRIGWLVHDGETFSGSALWQAVEHLPQKVRSRWMELLERLPPKPASNGWRGRVSRTDIDVIRDLARLAFIDDTHAAVGFGFQDDDDELSLPENSDDAVTVCRIGAARTATPFNAALHDRDAHIAPSEMYDAIWKQRFRELARAPIKHVSIVDRYVLKNHFGQGQESLSGLMRFLKLLDGDSQCNRYVTVYSLAPTDHYGKTLPEDDIAADIKTSIEYLEPKHLCQLTLIVPKPTEFKREAHDRFIRFGDHHVWDIGLGLAVFQDRRRHQRSAAAFKTGPVVSEYKQIERALENKGNRVPVVEKSG